MRKIKDVGSDAMPSDRVRNSVCYTLYIDLNIRN